MDQPTLTDALNALVASSTITEPAYSVLAMNVIFCSPCHAGGNVRTRPSRIDTNGKINFVIVKSSHA